MIVVRTIGQLLEQGEEDAVAIAAPGRKPLTYSRLRRHLAETLRELNRLGIGRNDPVGIVLPTGPEMASAFVAIGAAAAVAPLNPAYRREEFGFYLHDLGARLLVAQEGLDTPARAVANNLGIPIAELHPNSEAAGLFSLMGALPSRRTNRGGMAGSEDIALVLHTSGTTSRPKMVALSNRNVCSSAANVAASLCLTPNDCCLSIMPLFHIHGLVAAVLSPLGSGGSVFCSPGFNALRFFSWMQEANPTWYTAVPTMHQAILSRAASNRKIIGAGRLRLVRSSSAPLPPQVMKALEETFDVPVIEAYGMTEAAHQIASNPLPPRERKPGTVGLAAGTQIAVMGGGGQLLETGGVGEVVIKGTNVTHGYQDNPQANEAAFANGWFRTGDQGFLDADGYLHLTGRLKEIINRGGEKISPQEIDEVLLGHPAVAQAVTFALPHDKLGEDVAAAVVLLKSSPVSEKELRDYAKERLADFKVPRRIVFLDEIPKGPTGKLQRIGLAKRIGLA